MEYLHLQQHLIASCEFKVMWFNVAYLLECDIGTGGETCNEQWYE